MNLTVHLYAVRVIGSNSRCVKADIIPQHLPSADLGPYMRTHIETTAVAVGGSSDVRTHITTNTKTKNNSYSRKPGDHSPPANWAHRSAHPTPNRLRNVYFHMYAGNWSHCMAQGGRPDTFYAHGECSGDI